jgi:hypothetical protein
MGKDKTGGEEMRKMLLTVCLIAIAGGFVYAQGKNGAVQDSKENKTVMQNEEKTEKKEKLNIKIVERKVKKQPSVVKSGKVRIKEGYEKEVGKLEFLDNQGKVKKSLVEEAKEIERGFKSKRIRTSNNLKVIVVSDITESKNDYETSYNTGWDYKIRNDVKILDDDGITKGEIKGLECEVVGVSEDGEKILCFRGNPDSADDVSRSSDIDLGKMANVSIYTKDGELIFSKNSPGNGFLQPKLSPNGDWVVVRSYGPIDEIYVYGVNGSELTISYAKVKNVSLIKYAGITNNGEIEYEVWNKGKVEAKYLYLPNDKVLIKEVAE